VGIEVDNKENLDNTVENLSPDVEIGVAITVFRFPKSLAPQASPCLTQDILASLRCAFMAVDLKVRDLEMVVLLADTLNFHVVADALGITQPAVTKRLQDLERHVRARLFERDHSNVKGLTSHGHRFLRRARLSAEYCRLGIMEVQLGVDQDDPPFRAGKSPDIENDLVSVLHAVSLPMFPDLHLECSTDFSADLITALLEERLEIALVISPPQTGKIILTSVRKAPFHLAMRADHPLASKQAVDLGEAGKYPWVFFSRRSHPLLYDRIVRKADDLHIGHVIMHSILHADEALPYIASSDAIAWLSPHGASRVSGEDVCILPLSDQDLNVETFIATRADDRSTLTSEFVRSFMKKFKAVSNRGN
jgi:DNA-binding transcriptional LysR family regulator